MENQNKELLSNTLALDLALQTIKERCVHLQKRLSSLELENSRLKLNTINNDKEIDKENGSLSEIEGLRAKNAELTLQKGQLTDNLTMISNENRKLWRRLSQLTKEEIGEDVQSRDAYDEATCKIQASNLLRSKTFTQNSPHQLLKEKLGGQVVGPDELEDISLLNDCGYSEKITLGQDDSEACDVDSKACTDGMQTIKRELMKQNSDLKVALSNWRKTKREFISGFFGFYGFISKTSFFLVNDVCLCKKTGGTSDEKPVMVDKNLETDREMTIEYELKIETASFEAPKNEKELIDLIEQKRAADLADKVGSPDLELHQRP